MKLFVYGELCKPPVLIEVLGRVPSAAPAILPHYHRVLDVETGYYRALHRSTARLPGLLLGGIDEADVDRLDRFENVYGGEYERVEVEVRPLAGGSSERAWVYVGSGRRRTSGGGVRRGGR